MTESALRVAHSRCSVIVNSLPTISLLCAGCGTAGGVGSRKALTRMQRTRFCPRVGTNRWAFFEWDLDLWISINLPSVK